MGESVMISMKETNGVESEPTNWNPHPMIDATHDPRRESFVESANHDPDFPIQNLPLGIFSPPGEAPRGGVAIGDEIFDLKAAAEANLFSGLAAEAARAASGALLNPLFALEARMRQALRVQGVQVEERPADRKPERVDEPCERDRAKTAAVEHP